MIKYNLHLFAHCRASIVTHSMKIYVRLYFLFFNSNNTHIHPARILTTTLIHLKMRSAHLFQQEHNINIGWQNIQKFFFFTVKQDCKVCIKVLWHWLNISWNICKLLDWRILANSTQHIPKTYQHEISANWRKPCYFK